MTRKLLVALLIIALLWELALTGMAFFSRAATLQQLDLTLSPETDFLGYLVAWFLLFVSLINGLALWRVIKNDDYSILCYLLGIWWIGIGVGIYLVFKKPNNLFTDSLKGVLLIGLTWHSRRAKKE